MRCCGRGGPLSLAVADHSEEQQYELEALESIYPTEYQRACGRQFGRVGAATSPSRACQSSMPARPPSSRSGCSRTLTGTRATTVSSSRGRAGLVPRPGARAHDGACSCMRALSTVIARVSFEYTATYPDEPPVFEVASDKGLSATQVAFVKQLMAKEVRSPCANCVAVSAPSTHVTLGAGELGAGDGDGVPDVRGGALLARREQRPPRRACAVHGFRRTSPTTVPGGCRTARCSRR